MCKVSIVIPCYNIESKINNCLNALLNQTFKDFEVIFIDDCSTDNSYNILLDFKNNSGLRVKVLRLEKNSGPGFARNIGINNSAGEFLCFCDGDDWYTNEFLQKMVQAVDKGCEIAMCNIALYKRGDKFANYTTIRDAKSINDLIVFNDGSLCNIIFKKDLFQEINLPSLYHGEDMAIVPILISKANSFAYVDDDLYCYSVHQNSLSRNVSEKSCDELLKSFEFLESNIAEKYNVEVEFCGIKTIIYGYTLNAFKVKIPNKRIKEVINNFKTNYPKWYKNKYIKKFGFRKKIYLKCIKYNLLLCNKLYSKIHDCLLKRS